MRSLIIGIFLPMLVYPLFSYQKGIATIATQKIELLICETEEERRLGLGGRDELSDDEGMLFLFDNVEEQIFWMKGMLIPIDIIWMLDGTIVHFEQNVAPPSMLQTRLKTYGKNVSANAVLELSAGSVVRHNLKIGQKISIK